MSGSRVSLIVAHADDWEGLYIDDKLVYSDHRITLDTAISRMIGRTIYQYRLKPVDENWLEEVGDFPANLSDVKFSS